MVTHNNKFSWSQHSCQSACDGRRNCIKPKALSPLRFSWSYKDVTLNFRILNIDISISKALWLDLLVKSTTLSTNIGKDPKFWFEFPNLILAVGIWIFWPNFRNKSKFVYKWDKMLTQKYSRDQFKYCIINWSRKPSIPKKVKILNVINKNMYIIKNHVPFTQE